MKRLLLVVSLTLAVVAPAFAQQSIVQMVRDRGGWDFRTKAGLCAYSNAVVVALHAANPDYGQLLKSEGQNHCVDPLGRNVAVDATLYRPTGQAFDFIGSAGFGDPPPENKVWWGTEDPVGKYSAAEWLEPSAGVGGPPPVVTPPPVVVVPPPVSAPVNDPVLPVALDIQRLANAIYAFDVAHDAADRQRTEALAAQLKAHDEEPSWAKKLIASPYFQIVVTAVGTWLTTQQVMK
jgi:hypothetical protein